MDINYCHKALLTILFLFSCYYCFSQSNDSIKSVYNNQTIYRYGSYFLKGSERLTFHGLQTEFSMSDIGFASYTKAKRYRTISFILR